MASTPFEAELSEEIVAAAEPDLAISDEESEVSDEQSVLSDKRGEFSNEQGEISEHGSLSEKHDVSDELNGLSDEHRDPLGSAAGSEFDLDFSSGPGLATTQDPLSDEASLDYLFALPASATAPAPIASSPRPPLIVHATRDSRNTFFFLDHTRRLAITHYQRVPRLPGTGEGLAPQFVLTVYIRSSISMFSTPDDMRTILGWGENLLMLPAISHLLHELGLSGMSMRIELYDGQASLEAIIVHSRNEREHRHMCIEYLDCEKEMRLAKLNIDHGNIALDPAVNPRVGSRLHRGNQLQDTIRDFEAAKAHPNAWVRPANVVASQQAQAAMPHPTLLPVVVQPALFRHILPASPRHGGESQSATLPSTGGALITLPPVSVPAPGPPPSSATAQPPQPAQPPRHVAKPGSPLNPHTRSPNPIAPASFFLANTQPYHHAVLVIDEPAWQRRGLVLLKFDREKDWTEPSDVFGSLDAGDYIAERVGCFEGGHVEARFAERNTPERMKAVRIGGEVRREQVGEMEVVAKRWLGEALVETIKGGYFAHLGH